MFDVCLHSMLCFLWAKWAKWAGPHNGPGWANGPNMVFVLGHTSTHCCSYTRRIVVVVLSPESISWPICLVYLRFLPWTNGARPNNWPGLDNDPLLFAYSLSCTRCINPQQFQNLQVLVVVSAADEGSQLGCRRGCQLGCQARY